MSSKENERVKIMKKSYIERAQNFMIRYIKWCERNYYSYNEKETIMFYCNLRSNSRILVKFAGGSCRASFITSDYCIKIEFKGTHADEYGGNDSEIWAWENYINGSGFEYLFAKPTEFSYNGCYCEIMPRIKGVGMGSCDVYNYLNTKEIEFVEKHFDDMHLYNYGFKNRRPVIIDYAYQY